MHLLPTVGRWFLLVALVLLGIGVFRRINLLMLLGDALLMMVLLNLLAAGRSVAGLRGRRRIGEWLFARTPCAVEVQLRNPSRRSRFGLRIEDRVEGGEWLGKSGEWRVASGEKEELSSLATRHSPLATQMWFVDWLSGRENVSWRRNVIAPRRGRYSWGALWASSGYPFGLIERRVLLAAEENALVLPCLGWLHRGQFLRHLRGLSAQPPRAPLRHQPRPHPAAQTEFHGLRSYHSGDSPRLIHWRTSARRGELMVREFEDEPSDNLLLVIDAALPPPVPGGDEGGGGVSLREQFEEVISLAATICWEWCRRRGDRLILATAGSDPVVLDGLTGPAHARRTLECLAVLECTRGPANPTVIARLQAHRLPPALVVLLALGRSALAGDLRRALGRRVNCLDAMRTDRFDFYTPPN